MSNALLNYLSNSILLIKQRLPQLLRNTTAIKLLVIFLAVLLAYLSTHSANRSTHMISLLLLFAITVASVLSKARNINYLPQIRSIKEKTALAFKLQLKGQAAPDKLEIFDSQLYYIKACQNYCDIVYQQGEKQHCQIFRATLKSLEMQACQGSIMRTHKSYIINLNQVVAWKQKQNTHFVVLANGEKLPVSRVKRKAIKEAWTSSVKLTFK